MTRKRLFDVVFAVVLGVVLSPVFVVVAFVVRITSPGPILYWSDRVGRNNALFRMPKFRTMRLETPALATHLLADPAHWLTPPGSVLRRLSLDELPQLWSILRGDMSFVGPRPALFNQEDLVALRTSCGVHALAPGLTGWAQVNGRDELSITDKVKFDVDYLNQASLRFDARILILTFWRAFSGAGIQH